MMSLAGDDTDEDAKTSDASSMMTKQRSIHPMENSYVVDYTTSRKGVMKRVT